MPTPAGSDAVADGQSEHGNSVFAALARSLTRSAALYFSRPVRLFRPSKGSIAVSGWMFIQTLASQKGVSASPDFLRSLVRTHGLSILPRHFLPPLAVNAVIGSVLWSTYSEASSFFEPHLSHPLAVSLASGAIAGGAQAIVAAPAENVRILLEGGSYSGWSSAWKDVFRDSEASPNMSRAESLHQARQVREWAREVGDMAGRGWNGFTWGFFKDSAGFAVFFSLFELTRGVSLSLRENIRELSKPEGKLPACTPGILHGTSLVCGGILAGFAYEMTTRPFDEARRIVHAQRVTDPTHRTVVAGLQALANRAKKDGLGLFFRSPVTHESEVSTLRQRSLRVLSRMGPWGAGFLIWEAFGPGLTP